MKFKLQCTDDEGTVVTQEFGAGTWYESLDSFVKFLRGSGFQLKDNSVGINLSAGHMFLDDYMLNNITYFEQSEE
jgi:hypothetical protein